MQKNSEKRELLQKMISVFVAFIAFTSAFFIFAQVTFGWFASSTTVSGNGMGVQAQGSEFLQIRASKNGDDIGVTEIVEDMISIQFPEEQTKRIYPGVSGEFTFYVHDGSEGKQNSYSFGYRIIVKNNRFCTKTDYPQGFYPELEDADKEKALQYISSHILFFEHKEGDMLSGWINPERYVRRSVTSAETATPCEVTVYWAWIANYHDIFGETGNLLDPQTKTKIKNYYLQEDNLNKIMFGENSANAFNAADTFIGITIKYVCFEIDVVS